jgi:enamine deaminase RidA (YjgF/YER057c/UK114 family)
LECGDTTELYLTGMPAHDGDPVRQARDLFAAIRQHLNAAGARLFCERVFATREAMPVIDAVRAEEYGDLDDGIPPTRLLVEPGERGGLIGVQVHAIASPAPPQAMRCCSQIDGMAARIVEQGGHRWLFVNGLSVSALDGGGDHAEPRSASPAPPEPGIQAARMFTCAGCFLRQAGATMRSVARTWLWLGDVCAWYDRLNDVRRQFFEREGLIDPVTMTRHLPASTGIGIPTSADSICAMDMIALPGREDELRFLEAGGDQESAFAYGSAFSRATVAPMPAGDTLFISGTAAIDDRGDTEAIGQIETQIRNTLAHVRALLRQQGCDDRHVLTALAYCKNKAVEQVFRERFAELTWPQVTMIGEVCRPELLFEVEVTASAATLTAGEIDPCT